SPRRTRPGCSPPAPSPRPGEHTLIPFSTQPHGPTPELFHRDARPCAPIRSGDPHMVRSDQGGDVSADIQNLKDDLARLRDDVSAIAGNWMNRGRDRLSETTGDLQDRFHTQMETVTDWVKERPLQTVLIAGLAGLILGTILRR